MVHARNVKPPFAGAKLISIDESSVSGMPGFIKVLSKGNYVAVVCEREEQAINASRKLKTNWEKPAKAPFPASEDLFNYIRGAEPTSTTRPVVVGDPDTAFAGAPKLIEADYEIPFPGHTAFSGAHALADPSNGQMTIYTNDMKSYGMRRGVAIFFSACPTTRCASSGWKAPRVTAALPPTTQDARPPGWPKNWGAPFVSSGCVKRRRSAWIRKPRRSRSKCAEGLDAAGQLAVAYDYNARTLDYNHVGP